MSFIKYLQPNTYIDYIAYRLKRKTKNGYAHLGEDLIMRYALSALGIERPTYIDIGTNHPVLNNNTYLFYVQGGTGVCVEPNPAFWRIIDRERPRDVCLHAGVAARGDAEADFYVMSSTPLGTFSKRDAEAYASGTQYGKQEIRKILHLPLLTVSHIIEKYLKGAPDIMSIDTEGLDYEIVRSIDYSIHRPKIICVETARFDETGVISKISEIRTHLEGVGYTLFADTFVNSIFLDKQHLSRVR